MHILIVSYRVLNPGFWESVDVENKRAMHPPPRKKGKKKKPKKKIKKEKKRWSFVVNFRMIQTHMNYTWFIKITYMYVESPYCRLAV